MSVLQIPYNYIPREYQIPLWRAIDDGYKRIILKWPRRSGKTKTVVNVAARSSILHLGAHYHYFPEYKQGKRIVWDGRDKDGFAFLDHFPRDFVHGRNNQEMLLTMQSMQNRRLPGSIYNIIGSDKPDRSVGGNPIMCIFDEYSLSNPLIWDLMRPVLAENGGIAIFIFTPRGKNHAYRLWEAAGEDPTWFRMGLTVDDTGHIPFDVLERERQEIIAQHGDDAIFQQEYYCSFETPVQGSVYGSFIQELDNKGRIGDVPYEPALPVHTSWDLGWNDTTVIWFMQQSPFGDWRVIDHYENRNEMLTHYASVIQEKQRQYQWVYGNHYLPHDARSKDLKSGKDVVSILQPFVQPRSIIVVPRVDKVSTRIDIVRQNLPKCYFDAKKCAKGLDALKSYRYDWRELKSQFSPEPVHDWASNSADAFGQILQYYKRADGGRSVIQHSTLDDSYA